MTIGKKGQVSSGVLLVGVLMGLILVMGVIAITLPHSTPVLNAPLEKYADYNALVTAFQKSGLNAYGDGYAKGGIMRDLALPTMMATANSAEVGAKSSSTPQSATDFSKTNIQVAGVDEADIIKNDGTYIYAIAQGKLYIVAALPAESAHIVATLDTNGATPTEMFISSNSNRLLVFSSYGGYYPRYYYATNTVGIQAPVSKASFANEAVAAQTIVADKMMVPAGMPVRPGTTPPTIVPWNQSGYVTATVYNIVDKEHPFVEKTVDIEGSYLNSRLIGNNAYFVINSSPRYYYDYPMYGVDGSSSGSSSSGSVGSGSSSAGSSGSGSAGNALEISANNPTIVDDNSIIPLMRVNGKAQKIAVPTDIGMMPRVQPQSFITIASINLETLDLTKETVTGQASNLYASQDNLFLVDQMWAAYSDYNGPIPLELGMLATSIYAPNIATTEKTVISKFHLDNGKVAYVGQGVAPGNILNQFSMDEYNGNFRIATTVGGNWTPSGEAQLTNNLYVYNSDMNMVGALEGIAPGEKIYSVRFMGDKGYMVTFKTVDPLFVIDLATPSNPHILGKLKIPGYSDYMQPIDETHLLGIGKDVNELEDAEKIHTPGAVYYTAIKGIKMAIFDVSDVSNPIELHKVVIGERGTDSEALTDHKALLFDIQKNLLVLPITLVEGVAQGNSSQSFQGAIVYNVSLADGFSERGRITHVTPEQDLKSGYYYGYGSTIRRSLYMDNVLYTFSDQKLKANDLQSIAPLGEVVFPVSATTADTLGGYANPIAK